MDKDADQAATLLITYVCYEDFKWQSGNLYGHINQAPKVPCPAESVDANLPLGSWEPEEKGHLRVLQKSLQNQELWEETSAHPAEKITGGQVHMEMYSWKYEALISMLKMHNNQ